MNKTDKAFFTIFKIFHYYYFVLAIFNLIFIYFEINFLLNITTTIMIISIFIELCCGYIRGCLGILGYIISIFLSISFTKNIWIGIAVGISILNIIYITFEFIFNRMLSWLLKKFN